MTVAFLSGCILAGFLLPGLGWAVGARCPAPLLAAGVISALAIFGGVLGLALAGISIGLCALGLWLCAVALAGIVFWIRSRNRMPRLDGKDWRPMLPALPMIAVGIWRAIVQPLPGADVDFRWNYLAELIVQFGHLGFYPPHTAADFSVYFWSDGIAPLVSSLYAWTYLMAGDVNRHWTAIPVLLQLAGLFILLRELGGCWAGIRGGWWACALGGVTFLLHFAFNLGQESGLTALGGGGMVVYLIHWQRESRSSLLLPAAACASLVACAREYGMVFPIIGGLWILGASGGAKRMFAFILPALALPAAWHLRNRVLTGNPLYAFDMAGIFPVNPIFNAWMEAYSETYGGPWRHLAGWCEIIRFLGIGAFPALVGVAWGGWACRDQIGWRGTAVVVVVTGICWLASVPYTAGGLFYSMRVLSPLLVIGCAWGGAVLARCIPDRRHLGMAMTGLAVYGLDASLRALTVPANPYRISPSEWTVAGYAMQRDFDEKDRPFLVAAAQLCQGKVLSESAGAQRIFRAAKRELVPIWSPEVRMLFDPGGATDAADRLQAIGYSHVLLTRVQSTVDFLNRTGALDRLAGRLQTVMANDTFVLFALVPGPKSAPSHER